MTPDPAASEKEWPRFTRGDELDRFHELTPENEAVPENEAALRERLSRLSEASLRINESLDFDTVLQGCPGLRPVFDRSQVRGDDAARRRGTAG